MLNVVALLISCAVVVLFVWLAMRARRLRNVAAKWGGTLTAALAALLFGAIAAAMAIGFYKVHARHAPVPDIKVAGTPEQIKRGQSIAASFCGSCHSRAGTLTGGADLGKDFPIPVGSFVASNLTPTGELRHWTDGQIFRAIRNGVDADGHWLVVMSLINASHLSDDDTNALIAYIRSVPAAGQETANPPDEFNPIGLLLLGTGFLPSGKPVVGGAIEAPAKAPSAEYGGYILSYQDCRNCHGANLAGGVPGQLTPIGPGLAMVKDWKLEDFIATLRTGTDPSGHVINSQMPWKPIGNMDDDELGAIYQYLIHLPDL